MMNPIPVSRFLRPYFWSLALFSSLALLISRTHAGAPFPEFVDPHPAPGNEFGHSVVALSTGNVVITAPGDDAGGDGAGAVYLFNGATGALISTIIGASTYDAIGSGGVTVLSNGNFVIKSPQFDNTGVSDVGAVTWGRGTTGVSGVVSASNSLVGSSEYDLVGIELTVENDCVVPLKNGNYLVRSPNWDNGTSVEAGAVTWGSGAIGVSGIISASNSLVGSTSGDSVGGIASANSLLLLNNGNYVVNTPNWHNGTAANVGAVTWGSGSSGVKGVISASNSLVGLQAEDLVGLYGIVELTNGNYVVCSAAWDNGNTADVGAVTWGGGSSGVTGAISAANSLIGSSANDQVGYLGRVLPLTNGHYVVNSPDWKNGTVAKAGAVTWCNGSTGLSGLVSTSNSLVGSTSNDRLGSKGVTTLSNGHYVVSSPLWNNGAVADVGAATWCSGTTGRTGTISVANSLIGTTANDQLSNQGVIALSNGHFLVLSSLWDNATALNAGAVTWGNGSTGEVGLVSATNSLVGSSSFDAVGSSNSVVLLSNGNYVVSSPNWDNGATANVGAVTWGNATAGVKGTISTANSLLGSNAEDYVGSVVALSNGNYVVSSPYWNSGAVADVGAVTWGNGASGAKGVVSGANSIIGSTSGDQVGNIIPLSNGNYVIGSSDWDNGTEADLGAVTWASGSSMTSGVVSVSNSLIGPVSSSSIGRFDDIIALKNGNYLVASQYIQNGTNMSAGAVTFGNGISGVAGVISSSNSLVGTQFSDRVGSEGVTLLNNGGYIVSSSFWSNGALNAAGAVSFGSANSGVRGGINVFNSAIGMVSNADLKPVVVDNVNGTFFARFVSEGNGKVRVGSQTDGFLPDASLVNLTPSVGSLSPVFQKATFTYTLTVPNDTSTVTVTPTPVGSTITVNGVPVNSGSASTPINLNNGETSFVIVVTAADGITTKTYNVNVLKPGTLFLASATFTVISGSNATVADIVIQRTGGTGVARGTLSTSDGSAVAPTHYSAQTATAVNWAKDQTLANVSIPIPARAATTTARTFTVTLSAAGSGATLGTLTSALVILLPPAGVTDSTKPTLTLTAPAKNALINDNTPVSLIGTAKDNIGLKQVQISLNGGVTFTDVAMNVPGAAVTNFSIPLTPLTGVNTLQIKAVDFKGNTTLVTHLFTQLRTLTVSIDGAADSGTLTTGFAPNSQRQVGKSYTITATPKPGYVFNGWVANDATGTGITPVSSEWPALTFTFTEGLELTARFIANPFTSTLVGTFNGLVIPNVSTTPGVGNVGLLNLVLSTKGSFTGSLKIDGVSLSVPGIFDNAGVARFGSTRATSLILARKGKPDLVVTLQLDMSGSSGRITGSVTQSLLTAVQGVSTVTADRAHYSTANKVSAELAGTATKPYTLVFPAKTQTPTKALNLYPQGDGFATMTVKVDGTVSLTGKLADNTSLTASAPLSKLNQWPVFASLYSGKGCLAGLATLSNADANTEDITGADFLWFRPAITNTQWYPSGWPAGITVDVSGARYLVPASSPAASVFPGLLTPTSNATLGFYDGLLTGPIIKDITISPTNTVTNIPAAPSPTLTIAKSTGLISGTFTHSDGTKPAYQAVIIQKGSQKGGSGYFMSRATPVNGLGESGAVQVMAK